GILLLITFLIGCCSLFFQLSGSSYLPEILSRNQLIKGNANLQLTQGASQVMGPTIGGMIIQILTAPIAIIVDAFSFLVSFILILLLPAKNNKKKKHDGDLLSSIKEGVIFTFKHEILRPILISYSVSVLFIGLFQGIFILYMTRTLELSALQIGIVTGFGNIGFLIGAAVSKKLTEKFGLGNIIIYSLGLIALGFLIVGTANSSSPIPYLILGQFIMSIGVPLYNVNLASLRQAITPNGLLGRVNSVSQVFGRGGVPIGSTIGAIIASVISPRTAVIIAGIGGLLAILPAL